MKVEQLIHHLVSDDAKNRQDVLNKIGKFSEGGSPELKLSDKIELISHFRILNDSDLFNVCSKLINSEDESILNVTTEQIENFLSKNKRDNFLQRLFGEERLYPYAIRLVRHWKSRSYADQLVPLINSTTPSNIGLIVEALADTALNAYISRLIPLIKHKDEKLRVTVAQNINIKGDQKIPAKFIEDCLNDSQSEVRLFGLKGLMKQMDKKWLKFLSNFLGKNIEHEKECSETLRLLSLINNKKTIPVLVNFLFKTQNQSLRWSTIQALSSVDQKHRITYYEKILYKVDELTRPQVFELIGYCEGKKTFQILKKALKDFDDPGSKSLIAGALGTCGYSEAEKVLISMMELGVAEAYGAASALKNIAKNQVMDHFEKFLRRDDIDDLVKQIIIQHVSDGSQSMTVPTSLIELIEDFLKHKNDNIRYLSLIALKNISARRSIMALLGYCKEEWENMFKKDWQEAISSCCNGFLNPLLKLIIKADQKTIDLTLDFIREKPLVLKEDDLALLSNEETFKDWKWDEDLLHCVELSHQYDKSLIWRMFSKRDLSEKMCCFIARGFEQAGPHIKELLDPVILVQCFSRFHSEKPLLLLAKLMSHFPSIELIPPLVQYSESADEETQTIFRALVRKMILNIGLPTNAY